MPISDKDLSDHIDAYAALGPMQILGARTLAVHDAEKALREVEGGTYHHQEPTFDQIYDAVHVHDTRTDRVINVIQTAAIGVGVTITVVTLMCLSIIAAGV